MVRLWGQSFTLLVLSSIIFRESSWFVTGFSPLQNAAFTRTSHISTAWKTSRQRCTVRLNSSTTSASSDTEFKHGLAILTMPTTSLDRIANEAILETALRHTSKLSVVLQSSTEVHPSLSSLRRYVGEIYSTLWDYAMGNYGDGAVLDVVVYPQNLPNAAPEQWIHIVPDLDCVCSHDSICGWSSDAVSGRGNLYKDKEAGLGGFEGHVQAMNAERRARELPEVTPIHAQPWPAAACAKFHDDQNVVFMDDDALDEGILNPKPTADVSANDKDSSSSLLGGPRIPSNSLFSNVCVGGTFDGMHYGHRKLLTLAVSSVLPRTGKLLIGVTIDEMLQHKQYADFIPPLQQRMDAARDFVYRLAPGMKNRIRVVPIADAYGPPGTMEGESFDALVLSHETLETGHMLNLHRVEALGIKPLTLLCTRRTEPYGMSSTALRKMQSEKMQKARQY